MNISPTSDGSKKRKIKISVYFWMIYIIIPVLVITPILYFILSPLSEDILVPGLSVEKLEKIENEMKILETPLFQSLTLTIPEEFPTPKEKIGRKNPFAPVR